MRRPKRGGPMVALMLFTAIVVTGCGKITDSSPTSLMVAHPETRSADIYLIAGYNRNNLWENFNGYTNGNLSVSVPVGYRVTLHVTNDGGIPYDVGVYSKGQKLAFTGAGNSMADYLQDPTAGVMPGASAKYSFVANRVGDYRLADLLYQFPTQHLSHLPIGMWVQFHVTRTGAPHVTAV